MTAHRSAYHLSRATDLAEGLSAIADGGLYLSDECVSRVQQFFEPGFTPDGRNWETGERVVAIWLTHAHRDRTPVGMALVSYEPAIHDLPARHLVNVYVHRDHAGQGLGESLVRAAHEAYPQAVGFYTSESIAIYERVGVLDEATTRIDAGPSGDFPRETMARRHARIHADRWASTGRGQGEQEMRQRHYRTQRTPAPTTDGPAPAHSALTHRRPSVG